LTDSLEAYRRLGRQLVADEAARQEQSASESHPEAHGAEHLISGERALDRLRNNLARWFGPEGVDALITRALDKTRLQHPMLSAVERDPSGVHRIASAEDLRETPAGGGNNASEMATAVAALIATILELVGRLIGDDMTWHLVGQIWPESRSAASLSGDDSNNERSDK
jgi:hypothetical protein